MFEAAELLEQAVNLSAICRSKVIESAHCLHPTQRLFLNTHPAEQLNKDVLRSVYEIRERFPARRLVIDVHELAKLNVELGLDDFGAGRCRINEILRLRPAFAKFDRSLISGIDEAPPAELQAITSLIDSLKSLSIRCIAEWIEQHAEAAVCRQLGFELAQGFYFAQPAALEQYPLSHGARVEVQPNHFPSTPVTEEYDMLTDT